MKRRVEGTVKPSGGVCVKKVRRGKVMDGFENTEEFYSECGYVLGASEVLVRCGRWMVFW